MLDGLPIYVDEPVSYAPCGNHIVAHWKGREFHVPIAIADKMSRRLRRALTEWREGGADIIPFPPRKHG